MKIIFCKNFILIYQAKNATFLDIFIAQTNDGQQASASQLNIRGVYLHVLGDALGSVIVIISALIIMYAYGRWTLYVDPAMSIIMVVSVLWADLKLANKWLLLYRHETACLFEKNHVRNKSMKFSLSNNLIGFLKREYQSYCWKL